MGCIEVKEGEDVALSIENLNPQAGEIIVVNMKKNYSEDAVMSFAKNLQRILPDGTHVVINNNDMSIQYLSDAKLNELGYYKRLN